MAARQGNRATYQHFSHRMPLYIVDRAKVAAQLAGMTMGRWVARAVRAHIMHATAASVEIQMTTERAHMSVMFPAYIYLALRRAAKARQTPIAHLVACCVVMELERPQA